MDRWMDEWTDEQRDERDGDGLGSCMTVLRQQQEKQYEFNWLIKVLKTMFPQRSIVTFLLFFLIKTQSTPDLHSQV